MLISFLFKEACASNEINAPSSSLTLVVIEYAIYSITSLIQFHPF